MALHQWGGAAAAPVAGPAPAAANREKDKGSPAALRLFRLHRRVCKDVFVAGAADVAGLRELISQHKDQLRGADPTNVARRHPGTRQQLTAWFARQGPAVRWDDDAPPPCKPGTDIPRWFQMESVSRLSDGLQLDEVRCLELVLVAQEPELLRVVEDEQGLGHCNLAHRDDMYAAASEFFYMERSAMSKVLHDLLQGCHEHSILDPATRTELRRIVDEMLLRGHDGLAASLPQALVKLTAHIRELGNCQDEGAVRRRVWLRRERMLLGEALFFLYQAFPRGSEESGPPGVEKLVECCKALALDDSFFQDPPKSHDEPDDFDDRPGIVRALQMAVLSAMHSMPKIRSTEALQQLLGLTSSDGLLPWESANMPHPPSPAARLRLLKYHHYPRQRLAKPEVHGVQGVLLLAFLVLVPGAADEHDSPKNKAMYRFSLEHFALSTLRKLVLGLHALDACNCSDFRSQPDQMVGADLSLGPVARLTERMLHMIFKSQQLGLLPTLHEYKEHLRTSGKAVDEDRDGIEELLGLAGDLCLLLKDRRHADAGHADAGHADEGLWTELQGLLKFSEERANELMWDRSTEEGTHNEVFHFYQHHSFLTSAVAHANPLVLGPLVTGEPTETRFYRFWFNPRGPLSLFELGSELANMPVGHAFPGTRPRFTASLLEAWTAGLLAAAALLRSIPFAPKASKDLRDAVEDGLSLQPGQRGDPPLVCNLAWVATSESAWWNQTDGAEDHLPALRGAIFKFLASWVACDTVHAVGRAETVFSLLTRDETTLLAPASRAAQRGTPQAVAAGGHFVHMATLEEGKAHAATDGLLVLLKEVLPTLLPGRGGGTSGGMRADFGKVKALLAWTKDVLEKSAAGGAAQFGAGREGERFRVASRSLSVLLAVLEADKGAAVTPLDDSGPSWVLGEMLSRSTLLGRVLDLVTDTCNRDPVADAAKALDEYCATESRRAVRRMLVCAPKPPERRAAPGPDLSSKTGLEDAVDTWPWWRQRATALALALLASVGRRENDFISKSMDASRKQVQFFLPCYIQPFTSIMRVGVQRAASFVRYRVLAHSLGPAAPGTREPTRRTG